MAETANNVQPSYTNILQLKYQHAFQTLGKFCLGNKSGQNPEVITENAASAQQARQNLQRGENTSYRFRSTT